MAAMAAKFNFECVIQYYTDQWKTSFVQSKAVNDDFSPSEISSFLMPIGYC